MSLILRSCLATLVVVGLTLAGKLNLAAAADRVVPSDRVTNFVNVRQGVSTSSAKIGRLHPGERLEYVRSVPKWHEVKLPNGANGYVSKSWTVVERAQPPANQPLMKIHHLNIGAGTCTVVECPGENANPILVDCGSRGGGEDDLTMTQAATKVQEILSGLPPADVVVSHPDRDHFYWVAAVMGDHKINSVWQGGKKTDKYLKREDFGDWFKKQQAAGVPIYNGFEKDWHNNGDSLGPHLSCGLAETFVLTVNSGNSDNAQSLMLRLEYGDFSTILTGDAEGATEAASIRNFPSGLKTTVLSSSHHGASSHNSNSEEWAEVTAPAVLISSAGDKNGHPRCKAVERFRGYLKTSPAHHARCGENNFDNDIVPVETTRAEYVTSVNGTISVTTNGATPLSLTCERGPGCDVKINH